MGVGDVDYVQDDVGVFDLLKGYFEGFDEFVREMRDEPDCIEQPNPIARRKQHPTLHIPLTLWSSY